MKLKRYSLINSGMLNMQNYSLWRNKVVWFGALMQSVNYYCYRQWMHEKGLLSEKWDDISTKTGKSNETTIALFE